MREGFVVNLKMKFLSIITLFILFFVFISCNTEKRDWEKAESENTIIAYRTFLKHHSSGNFADKAQLKIKELYFKKARSIGTIQAYQDFLKLRSSQGPFAEKARSRLKSLYFEKAESENTIPTYQFFLDQYPQDPLADKVRQRIEELYSERHPSVKDTKTIKITVMQSYSNVKNVNLPFEEVAERVFKNAGLKRVIGGEEEDCDVILEIQVKGKAISESYYYSPYYTGASLSGTIALRVPGILVKKKSFVGLITPPKSILASPKLKNPHNAPFRQAFEKPGSLVMKLVEMMGELYGFSSLRNASSYQNNFYSINANAIKVIVLSKTSDSRAISPLISALYWKDVRMQALEKLKRITGKDFGEDRKKWLEWWRTNQEKFLKKE